MAKCRYDAQHALDRLFNIVPKDTKLVGAEVEDGKLVLILTGPSVPDVAEVHAADVRHEYVCNMIGRRTAFVPNEPD